MTAVARQSLDATPGGPHLVLYDGHCGLCHGLIQFVLRWDAAGRFHFAPLQGPAAAIHLARFGGVPSRLSTVYVVVDYQGPQPACRVKAQASLFILGQLGWPWRAVWLAELLPDPWLDRGYDLVARYRHRVAGRPPACLLPRPEHRGRFLDHPGGKIPAVGETP